MGAVLLDNWTLHDITYNSGFDYKADSRLADLENLLMAILLWDQIYFWDNGSTTQWTNNSQIIGELPSLTGLILSPEVDSEVDALSDADVVTRGAQQYQFIAEKYGIDYLPKQQRFQYLTSQHYYYIKNAIWQKVSIENVEKSVKEYYDDLMKMMEDIQLQFRFPLLLDYIRSQIGYTDSYIAAALHMRETGPLYNMRSWIKDLHNYIDKGNWIAVKKSVKDVGDIVSMIGAPLVKSVAMQVGMPPSASLSFQPNHLKGSHRVQLTFLRDLAGFALKERPAT